MNDNTTAFPCICLHDEPELIYPNEPDKWNRYALTGCEFCDGKGWVPIRDRPSDEIDWVDLYENPPPEPKWLFDPLVMEEKYTLIYSPPGIGKSLAGLWMAVAIAEYERHVGYIDNEMTPWDLTDRVYHSWDKKPDLIQTHLHYKQHTVSDVMGQAETLLAQAIDEQWAAIFIDTMRSSTQLEENDSGSQALFEREIINPFKKEGIAVVVFDHSGKDVDKGARGSSAKFGPPDAVWSMKRDDIDGKEMPELVIIENQKKRWQGLGDGVSMEILPNGLDFRAWAEVEKLPNKNPPWLTPGV